MGHTIHPMLGRQLWLYDRLSREWKRGIRWTEGNSDVSVRIRKRPACPDTETLFSHTLYNGWKLGCLLDSRWGSCKRMGAVSSSNDAVNAH